MQINGILQAHGLSTGLNFRYLLTDATESINIQSVILPSDEALHRSQNVLYYLTVRLL